MLENLKNIAPDKIFSLLREISRNKSVDRLINISDMIHCMLISTKTTDDIRVNFINKYSYVGYCGLYDMCYYYRVLDRFSLKIEEKEFCFLFELDLNINKYIEILDLFAYMSFSVCVLIGTDYHAMKSKYDFNFLYKSIRLFLMKMKLKGR